MSEEFNIMQTMNRLGKPINLLAVIAIATTGIITPGLAETNITTSQGSWKLAQAASVGQCRATKVQIPVAAAVALVPLQVPLKSFAVA